MRRVDVEKAREALRQHFELGLSQREIAKALNVSLGTVSSIITKARDTGITYPITLNNKELGSILYPPAQSAGAGKYAEPDVEYIHREMKKKGVTLTLLWEEYKEAHPDGFMFTQFCKRYRDFRKQNDIYMRKVYKAGERVMVDWAGLTMSFTDKFGELHIVYVFVASLPASAYLYVEPFMDMQEPSWIAAHVNAFEYFGGAPRIVTPDCTRTAINKPTYYDPEENRTYADMARHYGLAIIPARPYRPRDKSPVEEGVQHAERRIIAKLRKRQFLSFEELRDAVHAELKAVNSAGFKKMPGSRASVFVETEKPHLMPLPPRRYEYAIWKQVRPGMDYHVEYDEHFYSVPYQYAGKVMEARATINAIEIFHDHERIVSHARNYSKTDRYITLPEHMPSHHRAMADWTPERFERWASKFGSHTHSYICSLMKGRQHPEQAFKTCAGILRLGDSVLPAVMESICKDAQEKNIFTYKYFNMLFKRARSDIGCREPIPIQHANLRGSSYYGGGTNA